MRGNDKHNERGAAAVEFALVLTPLLLLVLGTIDWGYYLYVREVVANAAREGARTGAITPGLSDPAASTATALGTAGAYLTNAGLTAPGVQVAACDPTPANSVCVRILYPTGSMTGFLVDIMPLNATVQAAMRLE